MAYLASRHLAGFPAVTLAPTGLSNLFPGGCTFSHPPSSQRRLGTHMLPAMPHGRILGRCPVAKGTVPALRGTCVSGEASRPKGVHSRAPPVSQLQGPVTGRSMLRPNHIHHPKLEPRPLNRPGHPRFVPVLGSALFAHNDSLKHFTADGKYPTGTSSVKKRTSICAFLGPSGKQNGEWWEGHHLK